MKTLTKENFNFLTSLRKNNNRDWFNENKETYLKFHQEMIGFADEVLDLMQQHDNIETISGKKAFIAFIVTFDFLRISHPIKIIGVVALSAQQNICVEGITFI